MKLLLWFSIISLEFKEKNSKQKYMKKKNETRIKIFSGEGTWLEGDLHVVGAKRETRVKYHSEALHYDYHQAQ